MATGFSDAERAEVKRVLFHGLREDLGEAGDITSKALLPADAKGQAHIRCRRPGVVAGLEVLPVMCVMHAAGVRVELLAADGPAEAGAPLARLHGSVRGILAMERLALNLLGRLSGVATLTARHVAAVRAVEGAKAVVVDTRKTTPGLRLLEKYAVRIGGGTNHRIGLYDAILIKDNHLAALAAEVPDPIAVAVARGRAAVPRGSFVELEVDTLAQFAEALAARPDIVLLDNMDAAALAEAVALRDAAGADVLLEASGGVSLETIGAIAATGVDRISVGALTHSAACLDLGLDWD